MLFGRSPLQVLLRVVVILLLTTTIILYCNEYARSTQLRDLQRQTVKQHSDLLATLLLPYLLGAEYPALLDELTRLRDDHGLHYAGVYNGQQQLVASLGVLPESVSQSIDTMAFSHSLQTLAGTPIIAVEQPIRRNGETLGALQLGFSAHFDGSVSRVTWFNLMIAIIALTLSSVLLIQLVGPLQRNIDSLAHALRQLREGEITERLEYDGAASSVASAFNDLVIDMQKRNERTGTQQNEQQRELRRLHTALQESVSPIIVWEFDPQTERFVYVSEQAQTLLDYPAAVWYQENFLANYVHANDLHWLQDYFANPGSEIDHFSIDFRILNNRDEWVWLRMFSAVEISEHHPIPMGVMVDINAEKQNEQRIAALIDYDSLTELMTRHRWLEYSQELLASQAADTSGAALLVLDLSRSQFINNCFGHQVGDEYLQQIAGLLTTELQQRVDSAGSHSQCCRLGSDQFGIVLTNADTGAAIQLATRLLRLIGQQTVAPLGHEQTLMGAAYIGIALSSEHGLNAAELLSKAEIALAVAKQRGANNYHIFVAGTDDSEFEQSMNWGTMLKQALVNESFQVLFQPVVCLDSGLIHYYESTLWVENQAGELVKPEQFGRAVSQYNLADMLDRQLITTTLNEAHAELLPNSAMTINLNLVANHVANHNIVDFIEEHLEMYKLQPEQLIIGLSASSVLQDSNNACFITKLLQEIGFKIMITDVGCNATELAFIKGLQVDFIRLEEPLVDKLHWNELDQLVVKLVAESCKQFKAQLVATMVAKPETYPLLPKLGVSLGQGEFFAAPAARFHDVAKVVIADAETEALLA